MWANLNYLRHAIFLAAWLATLKNRFWATTGAVLAQVGVVFGGLALACPARRFGTAFGRLGAIVALVAGLMAAVNGGLVLTIADGGPGSGNGVVGGAAALVPGLLGMALGWLALVRSRRTAFSTLAAEGPEREGSMHLGRKRRSIRPCTSMSTSADRQEIASPAADTIMIPNAGPPCFRRP